MTVYLNAVSCITFAYVVNLLVIYLFVAHLCPFPFIFIVFWYVCGLFLISFPPPFLPVSDPFPSVKHNSSSHPAGLALAGAASVCAHDMIMTPMDVVKQRLQLGYYTGMWDCVRSVARTEGLGAFYRSYMTTLTMNVPLHGVLVPLNEAIKYAVGPRETYAGQLALSLGAGLIAGGVAAFVTTPLDVAKTRLQTQAIVAAAEAAAGAGAVGAVSAPVSGPVSSLSSGSSASSRHAYMGKLGGGGVADAGSSSISKMSPAGVASLSSLAQRRGAASVAQTPGQIQGKSPQYTGLVSALKGIFREEGWTGLMRGARPRVLVNAPSAAISWTTYEIGKSILLAYKN